MRPLAHSMHLAFLTSCPLVNFNLQILRILFSCGLSPPDLVAFWILPILFPLQILPSWPPGLPTFWILSSSIFDRV